MNQSLNSRNGVSLVLSSAPLGIMHCVAEHSTIAIVIHALSLTDLL